MKTKIIQLNPEKPDGDDIAFAGKIIRNGGLVVFPTETVYGIAADFTNEKALERLRQVKKRAFDKPFSMMIAQARLIANYTKFDQPVLYKLIDQYWPGPLTVVVPLKNSDKTVGIRIPDHKIALALVQEAQCPIAAPSANFEGSPAPVSCEGALLELDGLVDLALDGGKSDIGISSTVVDVTSLKPLILREGAIAAKEIESIGLQKTVLFVCTGNSCRSVMAEYLLKQLALKRKDLEVLSAGTNVFFHSAASSETIAVLREKGIDATAHQSRALSVMMLKKADLIFAMSRSHRQYILELVPEVEKRVYLLKEFGGSAHGAQDMLDIPDPIGTSHDSYRACLKMIEGAVQKIIQII